VPVALIVDDNDGNRKLARDLLSGAGFRTLEAATGAEAIALASEHEPDVVLMDIAMPVMDGIQATRAIRDEVPRARVVMVTGSAATDDVSRARSAGASAYVTKDQIARDLVRAILDAATV